MQFAQNESRSLNHEYIGTEHIMLALAKEASGVAANVLKNLGAGYPKLLKVMKTFVSDGPPIVTSGKLPITPRAKKALEKAMEEARLLDQKFIGTEHLLLGLIDDLEGVVVHVLEAMGIKPQQVKDETLAILGSIGPKQQELEENGMRDAVKPLFLFMHKHGLESVTLTKNGGNCRTSINFD